MIGPEKLEYLIVKRFIIIFSVARVDDEVMFLSVFEIKEIGDIVNRIPIGFFKS